MGTRDFCLWLSLDIILSLNGEKKVSGKYKNTLRIKIVYRTEESMRKWKRRKKSEEVFILGGEKSDERI